MAEWRTGTKVHKTIYRDNVLVGYIEDPALAAEVVEAMNRVAALDTFQAGQRARLWGAPESGRERSPEPPRETWTVPGYAHDAHCNAVHTAGPQPCPPPHDHVAGQQCGECAWPGGIGLPT